MGALLTPLLGKLIAGLAAAAALLAVYFGIKRKGVREERARNAAATAEAQRQVQERLDEARGRDAAIDAAAHAKVDELRRPTPKPPTGKPGDQFRF